MKIVPFDTLEQRERTHHARQGKFLYWQLLEGDEHAPGNFSLQLVRTFDDFHSPRHRHNFDQIRVQLEGVCEFGRDGVMQPGTVGYFPESVPYGPQKTRGEPLVLVLQFEGAAGIRYISERQYHEGIGALKSRGEFRGGFFNPADGGPAQDAFEAVWEHVCGRKAEYAPPRYSVPLLVHSAAFDWAKVQPGVESRALGMFTERQVRVAQQRLAAGARLDCAGRGLVFVSSGSVSASGKALGAHSVVWLEAGEHLALESNQAAELLSIELPLEAGALRLAA